MADCMALPFRSESFDTVVATLAFCTVPDPVQGLQEVRRVLRPTGTLLLLEHVRSSRSGALAWMQDRIEPVWVRLASGCHPNRDTLAAVRGAGFRPISVRESFRGAVLEIRAEP
jgi:ubiquinone/menaquinone biosynthesis C-methylase UbiE